MTNRAKLTKRSPHLAPKQHLQGNYNLYTISAYRYPRFQAKVYHVRGPAALEGL